MFRPIVVSAFSLVGLLAISADSSGQERETITVDNASAVMDEIMAIPARGIPASLLKDAAGVAIIPNVVKIGFVAGVRRGKGVVVVRDPEGTWQPPKFITLTGGSVGWQAGVQATDVVLVFRTRQSVEGLLRGKFTIGADAAAAAGPVGRQASAATDVRLKAEILSYSRSRGLFAGVSLDGSVISVDALADQTYYRAANQTGQLPPSAVKLLDRLVRYSSSAPLRVAPVAAAPVAAAPIAANQVAALRAELVQAATRLAPLLDERWSQYLALPANVYEGATPPSIPALQASLEKFDAVARNPTYQALNGRLEFQATQDLLTRYIDALITSESPRLQLPPPPATTAPLR